MKTLENILTSNVATSINPYAGWSIPRLEHELDFLYYEKGRSYRAHADKVLLAISQAEAELKKAQVQSDIQESQVINLPSDLSHSPDKLVEVTLVGSLVRITEACTNGIDVGTFGIIVGFDTPLSCVLSELEKGMTWDCYTVAFSFGSEFYDPSEFEVFQPSETVCYDLQHQLIWHLNALLALPVFESYHREALHFVVSKLHNVIKFDDDGEERDIQRHESYLLDLLFRIDEFLSAAAESTCNHQRGVLVDLALERAEEVAHFFKKLQVEQEQSINLPSDSSHSPDKLVEVTLGNDDSHHQSDEKGCEWQYKQDVIDAKRYRFLREGDFYVIDEGVVFPGLVLERLGLNGVYLDGAIDKAMSKCEQSRCERGLTTYCDFCNMDTWHDYIDDAGTRACELCGTED